MDASTEHESSNPAQSGQTKPHQTDTSHWKELRGELLGEAVSRCSDETRAEVSMKLKEMLDEQQDS